MYITLFCRADDAPPRYAGSKARSVLNRPKDDAGKSLKASWRLGLYDFGGLKVVDSFNFFQ